MSTTINGPAALLAVPDGTIVSWHRIPGDATSEAVAFVRREVDHDTPTPHGGPSVAVWLSPGGWEPMSIEQAGVNYPAHVVRWGEVNTLDAAPLVFDTLDSGGAYNRAAALDAAARVTRRDLGSSGILLRATAVTELAEAFLAWLNEADQ